MHRFVRCRQITVVFNGPALISAEKKGKGFERSEAMQPVAMVRRQAALGAIAVLVYAGNTDAFMGVSPVGMQRRSLRAAAAGAKRGTGAGAANVCMEAEGQAQVKKKVVVTGVGCVSSVGVGSQNFFDSLVAGKSGIQKMPSWAGDSHAHMHTRTHGHTDTRTHAHGHAHAEKCTHMHTHKMQTHLTRKHLLH